MGNGPWMQLRQYFQGDTCYRTALWKSSLPAEVGSFSILHSSITVKRRTFHKIRLVCFL